MADQHDSALRQLYLSRNEVVVREIDFEHVEDVIEQLAGLALRGNPITISFSSPGGVTDAGFTLAQFIEQELKIDVTGRVWGQCDSAATYPLLCCKQRLAHPQASFVIHRQTSGLELEFTDQFKDKLEEWQRSNEMTHQKQVDFYSRKLRLAPERVTALLDRGMGLDRALSATTAQEIGLITDITVFT